MPMGLVAPSHPVPQLFLAFWCLVWVWVWVWAGGCGRVGVGERVGGTCWVKRTFSCPHAFACGPKNQSREAAPLRLQRLTTVYAQVNAVASKRPMLMVSRRTNWRFRPLEVSLLLVAPIHPLSFLAF